jgi:hypothetical protein
LATKLRTRTVSSGLILLLVFAIPYLTLNLWRLARGRSWAFTFCRVMKEWDEGERIKRAAARATRQSPDGEQTVDESGSLLR